MTTQLIGIVLLIGLLAGILSGLVGVGGGIVLVPALVFFLHYNQHQAQGTSLGVLTFPVVILAFLHYYHQGKAVGQPIDFKIIGLLATGFIVGGYFGGILASKIDQNTLKKIFAIILFYTGVKMLGWDMAVIKLIKGWFGNR